MLYSGFILYLAPFSGRLTLLAARITWTLFRLELEKYMSTRFEILKNGERICISGIDGDGVLSFGLSYVKHPDEELEHSIHIGGLGMFDGSRDKKHHANWPAPEITVGDEITVRILKPGEFDDPIGMTSSPAKTIDDHDFGTLNYYVDAWDADIQFRSPPIETAHIHLRADESGPTQRQRDTIDELRTQHVRMWPEILTALVKCHPSIETREELAGRLNKHIGINIYDDSNNIELTYSLEGDPETRSYFVTVRNWEISQFIMAE